MSFIKTLALSIIITLSSLTATVAQAKPDVCNIHGLKAYTPYINTTNITKDGKTYDPGQVCHEFSLYTGARGVIVSTQYKLNDGKRCQNLALGTKKDVSCKEFRDYFHKKYSGAVDFFLQKYTVHKEGKIYPKEPEQAPLYPAPICPPPTPCQCICTGS